MTIERSPWWYRGRTLVFAGIFFAGFFLGGAASSALHHAYVPAYRELGSRLGPNGAPALLVLAVACALICYVLRVWGSSYLRAGTVWNADTVTDAFFIAGPFRFVRNPLYLGSVFLGAGAGLLAPVAGFILIVIGNAVLVTALARQEEAALTHVYGARFRAYAAAVPSMIPRLRPVPAQGSARGSLAHGVLAEVFTAAILIGIVVSFVDRRHGVLGFFILCVAGIVAQRVIARAQLQAGSRP